MLTPSARVMLAKWWRNACRPLVRSAWILAQHSPAAELTVTLQGAVDRVQDDLEEARHIGDLSRVATLQQELAGRWAIAS